MPRAASRFTAFACVFAAACSSPHKPMTGPPPATTLVAQAPSSSSPPPAASATATVPTLPPAPEPLPSRVPWQANEDPTDNHIVGPPEVIEDCHERLDAAGVTWREGRVPTRTAPGGQTVCGTPQPIVYEKGPTGLTFTSPAVVSCGLAIALARFERILQEEAMKHLGKKVRRVAGGGAYQCRKMARYDFISEHAFANAIDVFGFFLEGGGQISVSAHFGPTDESAKTPEAKFLRKLSRRLFDEGVFSNVLTPYFDSLHQSHFHLDLARYRAYNGTR